MMFIVAVFLVLVFQQQLTDSHFIVKTLPGFDGDLPFTLETGFVEVGESELFYYFVESEENPRDDPLMLWLIGGPSCTALKNFFYEVGPLVLNLENSTLEKPLLEINPYSWTKAASVIFPDQPAGTGFSYAKTPEAYITNDTSSSIGVYKFLKKWLMEHPKFLKNPFYLGGSSYMGIILPMVVEEILKGNEVGQGPQINFKGYVLGNPLTDTSLDFNSRIPFAHSKALLSDAIYKSAKENCRGEFLSVDPKNTLCVHDLQVVEKCLERINVYQILEPYCDGTSDTIKSDFLRRHLRTLNKTSMDIEWLPRHQIERCQSDAYLTAWANARDVREALNIPMELMDSEWAICNESLKYHFKEKPPISYTHNAWSVVEYHQRISVEIMIWLFHMLVL